MRRPLLLIAACIVCLFLGFLTAFLTEVRYAVHIKTVTKCVATPMPGCKTETFQVGGAYKGFPFVDSRLSYFDNQWAPFEYYQYPLGMTGRDVNALVYTAVYALVGGIGFVAVRRLRHKKSLIQ